MGSSSSTDNKTVNVNDTSVISNDAINILNQNLNNATSNMIINSNQDCVGTTLISQSISFKNCAIKNTKLVINGTSNATVQVNFGCIKVAKTESQIGQTILAEMMAELQKNFSVKSLNDMNNKASAESASSGILANSSASNSATNIYKLHTVNNNYTNLQNIIANTINSNLTTNSIQNCINSNAIQQEIDLSNCNIDSSTVEVSRDQNASINSILNCVSSSETISNTVTNIVNNLGLKVGSNTNVSSENEMKNDLVAAAKSVGISFPFLPCASLPIPGCGDQSGCCSWSICCCVVIIILLGLYWYFFMRDGSGSNPFMMGQNMGINPFMNMSTNSPNIRTSYQYQSQPMSALSSMNPVYTPMDMDMTTATDMSLSQNIVSPPLYDTLIQ